MSVLWRFFLGQPGIWLQVYPVIVLWQGVMWHILFVTTYPSLYLRIIVVLAQSTCQALKLLLWSLHDIICCMVYFSLSHSALFFMIIWFSACPVILLTNILLLLYSPFLLHEVSVCISVHHFVRSFPGLIITLTCLLDWFWFSLLSIMFCIPGWTFAYLLKVVSISAAGIDFCQRPQWWYFLMPCMFLLTIVVFWILYQVKLSGLLLASIAFCSLLASTLFAKAGICSLVT